MLTKVNTLLDNVSNLIVERVINGQLSLRDLEYLDRTSEFMVMEKLHKYDLQIWRYNIMKSLSLIELNKCKNYTVEFAKVYIDGMRDYREIIYIYHDGDEQYRFEEEWEEDEIDENYVPFIPVKVVDMYNEHYYSYLDAIHESTKEFYDEQY